MVVLMAAGCLFLWFGVPLLWLWVASQLRDDLPLGTTLLLMMLGAIATIVCLAPGLAWLNRRHLERLAARGEPIPESSPLEVMLVVSAAVALVGFLVWFLALSGSSPVPLNAG